MTDIQRNKQLMLLATQSVLVKYFANIVSRNQGFSYLKNQLDDYILQLEGKGEKQTKTNSKGSTTKKGQAEKYLEKAVKIVAGMIYNAACDLQDEKLKTLSNIKKSHLSDMRDNALLDFAAAILTETSRPNLNLGSYGDIMYWGNELSVMLNEYRNLVTAPQSDIGERKSATTSINPILAEAIDMLDNRMDPIAEQYELSHPDFFSEYTTARQIINRGKGVDKKGGEEKK